MRAVCPGLIQLLPERPEWRSAAAWHDQSVAGPWPVGQGGRVGDSPSLPGYWPESQPGPGALRFGTSLIRSLLEPSCWGHAVARTSGSQKHLFHRRLSERRKLLPLQATLLQHVRHERRSPRGPGLLERDLGLHPFQILRKHETSQRSKWGFVAQKINLPAQRYGHRCGPIRTNLKARLFLGSPSGPFRFPASAIVLCGRACGGIARIHSKRARPVCSECCFSVTRAPFSVKI